MSQILTQPVGLYSYLDTKLSILENRPNVGAGLVPAQNMDNAQITGQPQGLPLQHRKSPQVHQIEDPRNGDRFNLSNVNRT